MRAHPSDSEVPLFYSTLTGPTPFRRMLRLHRGRVDASVVRKVQSMAEEDSLFCGFSLPPGNLSSTPSSQLRGTLFFF